jgi:Uma2 family endonuclease
MSLAPKNNSERWTYADYLTWSDEERWEIIDGVAYAMSPAPSTAHQRILRNLASQINAYLQGKPCELFWAPFDVRLADNKQQSDNYTETVVQPDIVVICDPDKIDKRGCNGAPDIVIEITSPSTGKNDLTIKFDLYQRHGVKEYWIVLPEEKTVMIFKLQDTGKYDQPTNFGGTDTFNVSLLGDHLIDLAEVFAEHI